MKSNEQKQPIEVTLLKKHTHAGRDYNAGDKIKVSEPVRDWLATHGIIAKPPGMPGPQQPPRPAGDREVA